MYILTYVRMYVYAKTPNYICMNVQDLTYSTSLHYKSMGMYVHNYCIICTYVCMHAV